MRKKIKNILITTFLLFLITNFINFAGLYVNASLTDSNKSNFQNSKNDILSIAWVAITTNIWIRYSQKEAISNTIYKDVLSISEIISNKETAMKSLISNNMLFIKEYLSYLKVDIKSLLDKSRSRETTLNTYINWLELRFKNWTTNLNNLIEQKKIFEETMSNRNSDIETLKSKISKDFSNSDFNETSINIKDYLELKNEYNYARTYVIFINQFIRQYDFLNSYNKILLDTLINNKDALVKNSFVVLPDSGTQLIDKLDLIYQEQDYKNLNEEENKNNE